MLRALQLAIRIRWFWCGLFLVVYCLCGLHRCHAQTDDAISFNQQIRPILSDHCFACHGPDAEHRASDLRLDQRDPAVDYGAIDLEEPDQGLIWERIHATDPDLIMPPVETGKPLNDQQRTLIRQWLEQGAPYQVHWAFQPIPETVDPPQISSDRIHTNVDRFVQSQLKRKGWLPTEEADRETWLRRVTFDLTGLPPTLEEREAFLADQDSQAYSRVVDRLLASPAYGERMANIWLDVARYADTFGYQNDVEMEVWPWRDWVINAFNQNLPYDQFLTQQLAGDLLPNATNQTRLATTFNRLHRQTNEGGSVPEEFRLTGIADRTTTAGTAFLGLTLECCRCHDHKFDPIRQEEFYQFSAYFSDIDEFGLYSHFTRAVPTPALLLYEEGQEEAHRQALDDVRNARKHFEETYQAALKEARTDFQVIDGHLPTVPDPVYRNPLDGQEEGISGGARRCDGDNAIGCPEAPVFGRASPFTYSLWVRPAEYQPRTVILHQSRAAEDSGFRGLQLTLDQGVPQFSMIHFWPGDAVRIRAPSSIPTDKWTHLAVTHDGTGTAGGLELYVDGQRVKCEVIRDKLSRDIRHRSEWGDAESGGIRLSLGARFRDIGFRDGLLDELEVFDRPLTSAQVLALVAWYRPELRQGALPRDIALDHIVRVDSEAVKQAHTRLVSACETENQLVTGIRQIMTMRHDDQARPTHVLGRGEYHNPLQVVSPATPELTEALQAQGTDRLALARWMTDPGHPLTSRVIVNRMWHHFFGRGIVVTLEDFGSQGSPPSHPELLDYLARSLIEHDWDLHWLCREIVLSATYRQSSRSSDPKRRDQDPENIWLARGPKHRLSAEQLRDAVLAASGLLVRTVGGPSVKPYQPEGLWREAGTGKTYQPSQGEGLYRRSLYTFWKRTAPPPNMLTLDATSRESCTPRRELTTTPLQALVFLNDPQFVEASRVLGESLIDRHGEDRAGRWDELFLRLLTRHPSDDEQSILEQTYQEQKQLFQENPDQAIAFINVGNQEPGKERDPVDLAATTVVVQTLFAYDESIMLR